MKPEHYRRAHWIQEKISKLKYELEVLKQSYEKQTSIRFGTEFNVSIPIAFHDAIYKDVLKRQITVHELTIEALREEFNNL